MNAEAVISKLLTLSKGEVIIIPCADVNELERIRVALYRQKQAVMKAMPQLANIKIQRSVKDMAIVLSQEEDIPTIIIRKADGTEEKVEDSEVHGKERARIADLMRQDGATEEEIDAYFAKE